MDLTDEEDLPLGASAGSWPHLCNSSIPRLWHSRSRNSLPKDREPMLQQQVSKTNLWETPPLPRLLARLVSHDHRVC